MKSKANGEILTMVPGESVGAWIPASAADRSLLARIQRPRRGDPARHPDRDRAGFLIGLCVSRGIALLFDPCPAPGKQQTRAGKLHATAKV